MSKFGRQNRTNTGVAPAQTEVFVRGLFADEFSGMRSWNGSCAGVKVNGMAIFRREHCVWSCVHR